MVERGKLGPRTEQPRPFGCWTSLSLHRSPRPFLAFLAGLSLLHCFNTHSTDHQHDITRVQASPPRSTDREREMMKSTPPPVTPAPRRQRAGANGWTSAKMQEQVDRGYPLFNSRREAIKVQKTNLAPTSTLAYYLPKENSIKKMKIQRFVSTLSFIEKTESQN